jgi:hypothetical protein
VADRAACGGIIGAAHTLLSTMLTRPKSLENRDALSRKTMNDWGTSTYICAVSVPNETNKEQIAALATRGEQIKTNSAEFLWICCGIKPPPLPDKSTAVDPSADLDHLHLQIPITERTAIIFWRRSAGGTERPNERPTEKAEC